MSLDGFIAGPSGEADWIVMDPKVDFGALMGAFDTVLLGRKSYEIALIPVLLGEGIPVSPALARATQLRLANHRIYAATGTVMLEYAPA